MTDRTADIETAARALIVAVDAWQIARCTGNPDCELDYARRLTAASRDLRAALDRPAPTLTTL